MRATLPGATLMLIAALTGPALADLKEAQVFVNDAAAKFRQADFAGALAALEQAEPLAVAANDPSLAQIRFNIARCYEELGRNTEALAAWERYLKLPDQPHRKERALTAMAALRKRMFGTLAITCEPAGAALRIGDAAPVPCPLQQDGFAPGSYPVEVSFDGYRTAQRVVEVVAGETATASFRLEPLDGGAALVVPDIEPAPAPFDPWPWVTVGAGLVAAGGGAVFTFSAISSRDEADTLPPGGTRDTTVDDYETAEAVSWALYGVGAAAVVTGLIMMIEGDDAPAAIAPTANGAVIRW